MAKCSDKRLFVAVSGSIVEPNFAFVYQLFPSGTTKCMLQIGHTFEVSVTKYFSEDCVVANTQRSTLIFILIAARPQHDHKEFSSFWQSDM